VSEGRTEQVAAGLERVRARIAAACQRAGRSPDSVQLIAVSKGQPAEAIRAVYARGQREFGENYVQELQRKAAALTDLPELRLRFIGHLQRNKAKDVVKLGCAVDSVDSLALAEALSQRALAAGRNIDVMIQVNIDREPQKAGVLPAAAHDLVAAVRALPGLALSGLMAIPSAAAEVDTRRAAFAALRELAAQAGLRELSMGMSDDLELAIEQGATRVRVGTAIFGERPG
jgi:pyridoxal phosphate enzyme (YggS family)